MMPDPRELTTGRWGPREMGREMGTEAKCFILNATSSGERIWYQFGALVCWTIEQESGRHKLVDSIADPAIFDNAVSRLLTKIIANPKPNSFGA